MVTNPLALRNELALEIRRWFPAMTWGESLAAADAAIAELEAGNFATPVAHHPLTIFIANTFIVPWSWATAAFDVITGGGVAPLVGFVTVWRTTAANETITVPVSGAGYNCVVNWGDGTANTNYTTGVLNHVYAVAGDYTVTITGTFPRIFFNNGGDKLKLIKILNWGDVGWTIMSAAFYGCTNLNEVSATDVENLPGGSYGSWFALCSNLPTVPLGAWDATGVTSLNNLFQNCSALTEVDVSGWDTSIVTNLAGVFVGCVNLTELDVSGWNTALNTTLLSTFSGCISLSELDVSGWDTANVLSMDQTFRNINIPSLDLSGWDVSKVTTFSRMIYDCENLTTIGDISTWNTAAATTMLEMFYQSDLMNPDVSGFDMGLVTTANNMFTEPCALSNANYDALLIAWAAQSPDLKPAVPFGAGGAKFSAGAATTARGVLTTTHTWAITDGGPAALLLNTRMLGPTVDLSISIPDVDVMGNGWNVLTGSADIGNEQCVVGPGGIRAVVNTGSPNVVVTAILQAFAPIGLLLRSRVGGVRAMRVVLDPIDGSLRLERVDAGGIVSILDSHIVMPIADTTEHHVQVWVDAASRYLVYFDGVLTIDMVETYQMNRPRHGIIAGPGAIYLREFSVAEFPA